jgi:hypothetical protein
MHSVIVEFQYGEEFDRAHIAAIARKARGRFEGLPRLRQKTFTIDRENRRATNVYLWESERRVADRLALGAPGELSVVGSLYRGCGRSRPPGQGVVR